MRAANERNTDLIYDFIFDIRGTLLYSRAFPFDEQQLKCKIYPFVFAEHSVIFTSSTSEELLTFTMLFFYVLRLPPAVS